MEEKTFFGQNLKTLIEKWGIDQQDLEAMMDLNRGNISYYASGRGLMKPPNLVKLEQLTGIPIYRWLKTNVYDYELPPEPLQSYVPAVNEDALHYGPTVSNTPLPTLIRELSERIKRLEDRVNTLENCQ